MARALEVQKKGVAVRRLIEANGRSGRRRCVDMYSAAHAAMNVLGLPGGYPRAPLQPVGEPHLTELREGFEELGIGSRRDTGAMAAELALALAS